MPSAPGGMPDLSVLLDDGTGTFPYDVTTFVRKVDGMVNTRGRADEQSTINPGQVSLTFDNSTGAFTLGSVGYGIHVDQKIRVRESVDGGAWSNRFTGYVEQWPAQWPDAGPQYAVAQVTAFDELARQQRRMMASIAQETILPDGPTAYWPLGDPDGATVAINLVDPALPLVQQRDKNPFYTTEKVVFGTEGAFLGGGTAASFAEGFYLTASGIPSMPTPAWVAFEGLILPVSTSGSSRTPIFVEYTGTNTGTGTTQRVSISVTFAANPNLFEFDIIITDVATETIVGFAFVDVPVDLDIWHHVALECGRPGAGGTIKAYVDGVAYAIAGTMGTYPLDGPTFEVGLGTTGSVAHAAYYAGAGSVPGVTRWANHANAALNGFTGELGDARITRLAGLANTPLGTFDAGQTPTPAADLDGKSVGDVIQSVASGTEVGTAYVDGSGDLVFHNRSRVTLQTTPAITFQVDSGIVNGDLQVLVDKADLVNYATTQAEGSGVITIVTPDDGGASELVHGRYPASYTWLVTKDTHAVSRAAQIVNNHAEPSPRIPTLTLDLLTAPTSVQTAVLALDLDDRIDIAGLPAQSPTGTTAQLVIDGYTETLTVDSWTLQINATSWALLSGWILEDTTYGVLDSTTRLTV
jgi:hypothetical protein